MKLHVGCGQTKLPGYINIDGYDNDERPDYWVIKPDLIAKADELEQHFSPGTIDEIRTHHMLEHIPIIKIPPVLICWNNILKIVGKLTVSSKSGTSMISFPPILSILFQQIRTGGILIIGICSSIW